MYSPRYHPVLEYFRRIKFVTRIFFAMFPKRFVNRGYEIAQRLLFDTVAALDGAGVPYHLDYGTLLGMVRDGDFIPWDNDVDLAIFPGETDSLRLACDALRQRGWKVREFELPPEFDADRSGWRPGDTWMVRVIHPATLRFPREYWVELVIKRFEGPYISWVIMWHDQANICSVDSALVSRTRKISYAGRLLLIPEGAEAYLSQIYSDWRTPKTDYDAKTEDGATIRTLPLSNDA
jgi:hypothetical protein